MGLLLSCRIFARIHSGVYLQISCKAIPATSSLTQINYIYFIVTSQKKQTKRKRKEKERKEKTIQCKILDQLTTKKQDFVLSNIKSKCLVFNSLQYHFIQVMRCTDYYQGQQISYT